MIYKPSSEKQGVGGLQAKLRSFMLQCEIALKKMKDASMEILLRNKEFFLCKSLSGDHQQIEDMNTTEQNYETLVRGEANKC